MKLLNASTFAEVISVLEVNPNALIDPDERPAFPFELPAGRD
jgi:hypothetical protein